MWDYTQVGGVLARKNMLALVSKMSYIYVCMYVCIYVCIYLPSLNSKNLQ